MRPTPRRQRVPEDRHRDGGASDPSEPSTRDQGWTVTGTGRRSLQTLNQRSRVDRYRIRRGWVGRWGSNRGGRGHPRGVQADRSRAGPSGTHARRTRRNPTAPTPALLCLRHVLERVHPQIGSPKELRRSSSGRSECGHVAPGTATGSHAPRSSAECAVSPDAPGEPPAGADW